MSTTKRGQNEGHIYKRADGRWEAKITVGLLRRRSIYGPTRQEVARKMAAALRDHQHGLPAPDERLTVQRFLEGWLADSVQPRVRPWTYRGYEVLVRRHILPELGRLRLAKLSPQHVQTLINNKAAGGLAPKTVHYMRQVLRTALGQALRWGLVSRNVAALVDVPRRQRQDMLTFTIEEARGFLSAIKGDRLEALYTVALAVGLRQGEALALAWADVDLRAGTIDVRHTLQRVGGVYRLLEPKTVRSRRRMVVPASVLQTLREHRKRQLEERLLAGSNWQGDAMDLVFTTIHGRPLDGVTVTRQFQRLLQRSGLPRLRYHDLRHSCATLLLVQGVAPRVVMETLGHSDISLTMNTYSHVLPELQREAAQRMDDFLSGASV